MRNPFGFADVPAPNGDDVLTFASSVRLDGGPADPNAEAWPGSASLETALTGAWSSRWNGGADPTIRGDAPELWKPGRATLAVREERIYLLFDWDEGRRTGLLEAIRDGARWHGRYVNLSDPTISRAWAGLCIDHNRIDGRWAHGRLDFRR